MSDVSHVLRAELRKLTSQILSRVLVILVLIGPPLFTAIAKLAGAKPGDTLLGAWIDSSGFDAPLVLLAFAASFGF